MAEDGSDFSEEWDEYAWERFLQQQDRITEKYIFLLEKYMNHPDRDWLIAKEMGWGDGDAEIDGFISELEEEIEDPLNDAHESLQDKEDLYAKSPLFQRTLRLNQRISRLMDRHPELEEHPEMIQLAACAATCGTKLAGGIAQTDFTELGMRIAYLKRGLKAANDALGLCESLITRGLLTRRQLIGVRRDLFTLRNATVARMGECRAEWRRRFGHA